MLWTGTVEPRKNLKRLLEAWRAANRSEETLVLAGPRGWHEDLDTLISSVPNVRSVGFVDRATLAALYAGAAAFCWPSLREGFGFPVLEAMSYGCPVITSRGTSTEEIAGDAALLVDPTDPHEIADALSSVLDDRARADDLIRRGRGRAANFTWQRTAEGLSDAYSAGLEAAA